MPTLGPQTDQGIFRNCRCCPVVFTQLFTMNSVLKNYVQKHNLTIVQ